MQGPRGLLQAFPGEVPCFPGVQPTNLPR